MSILGQADPGERAAAAVESASPVLGVVVIALGLAGLVMLWRYWRAGVFRAGGVVGPDRTPLRQQGWPTLVALMAGTCFWVGTQAALGSMKQARWVAAGNDGPFKLTDLTPGELALFSTVPGVMGFLAVVLALRVFRREERPALGASASVAPWGLFHAVGGMLFVLPLILLGGHVLEWVYRVVEFEHPSEHDMLRAMKDAPVVAKWGLILGAVLVAPAIEEVLFRGLFQTLLVWAFTHGMRARPVVARWAGILLASLVFALIHDLWSAPLIFLLSVCLGYAYERTGNLWLAVGMHALFNGSQTLLFLLVVSPE
jgi:membrane protease YdiL (CAAX protease family)